MRILFKNWEKNLFWISITLIIVASYRFYSSRYYPLLNSDDALNILMTFYYKLPKDIYCWGQNRGGTLIPLIGQLFYRVFNFSAVNAVSLSNYLLLIIGFLGFSSLFKSKFTKVAFAIFWFLPPIWFIDSLRFPYGVEYCLIGAAVFIINKLDLNARQKITVSQHLLLVLLIIIFTATVWVSDLASVTIIVLLSTLLFFHLLNNKFHFHHKIVWFYFIAGCAVCAFFISYAKGLSVPGKAEYLGINTFDEMIFGLNVTKNSLLEFLSFKHNMPLMSVYAYLVILLLILIIISFFKQNKSLSPKMKQWFIFFLLDGFIIFIVILFSHWVSVDGYGRRFFICSYISFGLAILILADHLITISEKKNVLRISLLVIVIVGAGSTFHYLKFVSPKNFKPMIETMREFETLGKCAILADYWNAYLVSSTNPGLIKASPHEYNGSRNDDIIKEIFKEKYIYIMKEDWLETYPDQLAQYWHLLYKDGDEFFLGGKSICRYRKIN